MGITSALTTALSGLSTSQTQISVVGNNIANVNTVGFKSSRLDFKTQLLQNYSFGTAPNGELGGSNPLQIGLGTQTGAISRDFTTGALQATGVQTNLAIQGDGFFVLKEGTETVYTRDGSFQLNGLNQLVSENGALVQGYGIDASFNLIPATLSPISIPVNNLTVAEATQNATVSGIINAAGVIPSTVSSVTLAQPFYLSNGAGGVDPTNPPTTATLLTDVTDSTGAALFQTGDVINLTGRKGGTPDTISITPQTLTVTGTTTLADLQAFFNGTLGINTTAGANGSIATTPGVTFPATTNTATLTINGNPGTANDIVLDSNSLSITRTAGPTPSAFTWNLGPAADGESVRTPIKVYDSLGTELDAFVTLVLESKSSTGSTWRYFVDSPGGTGTGVNTQTAVGTGTLNFDTLGTLITPTTQPTFTIDRSNSGAQPTLTANLSFALQAYDNPSVIDGIADGHRAGTLTGYQIGEDGIINGSFDNGVSRVLGQIVLATFRNNQGLIDKGGNVYTEGPNSGTAIYTTPGSGAAGKISSGALELSNVDLSSEFVRLISASTAFSASSRVITSSNQLLQELLSAAR